MVVSSKLGCSRQSCALVFGHTDNLCSSFPLKDPALHLSPPLCSQPCICFSTVQHLDFIFTTQLTAQSLLVLTEGRSQHNMEWWVLSTLQRIRCGFPGTCTDSNWLTIVGWPCLSWVSLVPGAQLGGWPPWGLDDYTLPTVKSPRNQCLIVVEWSRLCST